MNGWTGRSRSVCGLVALMICHSLNSTGTGLIGGTQAMTSGPTPTTDIYAAFVSLSGVATELTGSFPTTGSIVSTAINGAGHGIIGGADTTNSELYAALVSPAGVATSLTYTGSVVPTLNGGTIYSVAINSAGSAIIGGIDNSSMATTIPYVALVSPSGVATALTGSGIPVTPGTIFSVAMNDAGNAIIGGFANTSAIYAAVISPAGEATAVTGAPTGAGSIQSVAINSSGTGIIGGQDITASYAALVSPSGVATSITGALPALGIIQAVAINEKGTALIGGQNQTGMNFLPYAALVSPDGVATTLSPPDPPIGVGAVTSIAINNSGAGVIGGYIYGGTPYIALVSPAKGINTIAITGEIPVGTGNIQSVAINDAGISLVGGVDHVSATPYAALISPLGVATTITGAVPIGNGQISAVALQNILTEITPTSFGPGSSFANALFALSSQILPNHFFHYHPLLQRTHAEELEISKEIGLLAHGSDKILAQAADPTEREGFYSIWGAGFGEYAHSEKTNFFPSLNDYIAGALLCFEGHNRHRIFGGGIAYAYNYVALSENQGQAKIQEEFATFYASFIRQNFYIHTALWGGLYQMHNVRHSIMGLITSTAYVNGWLFSPHFEVGGYFYGKKPWFSIEPFGMVDWANNWQSKIQERGSSGFNVVIDSQYTSLLRSEIGIRFFENLQCSWGNLILMEKASYVNKTPFNAGTTLASFIGSVSSFALETFSSQMENLGAVQFKVEFRPSSSKSFYGSINFQGEAGSSFQSALFSFELGKDF